MDEKNISQINNVQQQQEQQGQAQNSSYGVSDAVSDGLYFVDEIIEGASTTLGKVGDAAGAVGETVGDAAKAVANFIGGIFD